MNGTGVALVTPFHKNGSVDEKGLENLIEHLIAGGVDYLVALGTTAETATLSDSEKEVIVSLVLTINNGRLPVVLGLGGNNTAEIIKKAEEYDFDEIAALLSVSPYYNKPTQEGIYQHYKAIAKAMPRPVILYNVPGRTSSNLTAETTLRLAHDVENIIGTKEASGDLEQIMRIIAHKPADFEVISGDDALTLPILSAGGSGVISVIANAFPGKFSDMVRLALKENFTEARLLHYKLLELIRLIFAEGNPAGIKALLSERGICEDVVRLPLVGASASLKEQLRVAIKNLR